ncbi:hypothetical protein [Absidia glauca]|uniref:Uncharacterized protein n=1 Tax=Absidia glauca TaxID=4829 RepID=A0A163J1R5_ABSGL|nr:hypothetical protein [Absidia glauca]
MDPKDFPSLQANEGTRQDDNRLDASWAKVAKESSNSACGHGDNVNQKKKGGRAKQNKGKLLNKDAPEFVPQALPKTYADATSHAGFPALQPSSPIQNSLSSIAPDEKHAHHIPPPPANASFAKIAATEPPPSIDEKTTASATSMTSTTESLPSIDNQDTFPPIQSSPSIGRKTQTTCQPSPSGPSYVEVASKDLDQAAPPAQPKVDALPTFDEYDMMASSARHETRVKKQDNIEQHSDDVPEQSTVSPTPPSQRQYKQKFTLCNTITMLRANGYSWLTSLILALLLHIRYSPCTSHYRFFPFRSLTDLITLPIYTRALHSTLLRLPFLNTNNGHQKQGQGLTLQDGFQLVAQTQKLRWWQFGLWASYRIQWLVAYMALQDSSAHLVPYATLAALKNEAETSRTS